MKPRFSNQRNQALTLTEVLVVVVVLAVLIMILFPPGPVAKDAAIRINCVNNLKQIGLAYRIWEGDHGDKFPMQTSVTNGGTMGLANGNNAWINFFVMSNELGTPKLLICLADTHRIAATNFTTDFNNSHISYFVGLDADETHPKMLLSGDDNFDIGGVSVKSGLLQLLTNTGIAWDSSRHVLPNVHFWTPAREKFIGNIGLTDGSVQTVTVQGLQQALQQSGIATNRLAIP
jgi:prepilin-type N-terminal cleavage/methylation domain-containing protein